MRYGFLDEAGDVGYSENSSRILLVVILLTDNPQELRRAVARIRKGLGRKLKEIPELKAYATPRRIVEKLLRYIAQMNVEIVASVVDKRVIRRPSDPEDLYRWACVEAIRACLKRYPNLSLCIDKRSTNRSLRDRQNRAIAKGIADMGATLVLQQIESERESAIQGADAIAWSLFQKYEHRDEGLFLLVKDKIVVERALQGGIKKPVLPGGRCSPGNAGVSPAYTGAT